MRRVLTLCRYFLIALTATFVACSGGAGTMPARSIVTPTTSPTAAIPTAAQSGRIAITFNVPNASASSGHRSLRNPKYVSASTYQAVFIVTPQNGTASAPQIIICQALTSQGKVCGGTISAPAGVDSVAVTLEDQPVAGQTQGNALSSGTVVAVVQAAETTTVHATLDGIVHSVTLAFAAPSLTYIPNPSPPTDLTTVPTYVAVNALDADGNIISYDGSYLDGNGNAFGLTVSVALSPMCPTCTATPASASVSGPGTIVPVSATISESTGAVTETLTASGTVFVGDPSIVITSATSILNRFTGAAGYAGINPGNLYANLSGVLDVFAAVNGTVPANATPRELVNSTNNPYTESNYAPRDGIATDGVGDLYFFQPDSFGDELLFEIPAVNGSIPGTPTILLLGGPSTTSGELARNFSFGKALAVDREGNLFVLDRGDDEDGSELPPQIEEVLAVNGSVPPNPATTTRTVYTGYTTQYTGIAVDKSDDLFVTDTTNSAVDEIVAVNGSIPANPTIKVFGTQFNEPSAIAVDGTGNVFVLSSGDQTIREIVAVNGVVPENPAINTVFTLAASSADSTLAIDQAENLYVGVVDSGSGGIEEILASYGSISVNSSTRSIQSADAEPLGLAIH